MTYDEFLAKYNGKYLDFDGYYGYQCMDLAQYYNKEVVGAPRFSGNAKDIWYSYPKDWYTQIENTITAVPQKGDVIIWGASAGGGYGHIAICNNANVLSFVSLDQNWPVGSKSHLQSHNYLYPRVLGWLRPKKPAQPITVSDRAILEEINQKVRNATTNCVDKGELMAILAKAGL